MGGTKNGINLLEEKENFLRQSLMLSYMIFLVSKLPNIILKSQQHHRPDGHLLYKDDKPK